VGSNVTYAQIRVDLLPEVFGVVIAFRVTGLTWPSCRPIPSRPNSCSLLDVHAVATRVDPNRLLRG
jgi:hypothetical protein